MSKPKWPETVPYLLPENMHPGSVGDPGQCMCLMQWVWRTLGDNAGKSEAIARAILVAAGRAAPPKEDPAPAVIELNDLGGKTAAELACIWNKAMANLGYTEDAE